MRLNRQLFGWRVTRALFALGALAIISGALRMVISPSGFEWIAILVGLVLIGLSTRSPWDSEASGRNRSVLGFRVRPKNPTNDPE